MSATLTAPTDAPDLAPVAPDMSAWIIAGAVASQQQPGARDTEARTPAQGVQDGVDAERLGFRRVWLSERWDIKIADVILSAIAAKTTRLGVGSGIIDATTRHPMVLCALGATMHACFGERFVLGLGRGDTHYMKGSGIEMADYQTTGDYIDIIRALWRGETVVYDGPVGKLDGLAMSETYHGKAPEIWFGGFALPKGAKLIAEKCDGVLLPAMYNPAAAGRAVERIHAECERIGRDPSEVRIVQPVVTAPDMDEIETRSIAHGRAVTYVDYPWYGDILAKANGWDVETVHAIRNHELFAGGGGDVVVDRQFHRHQLLGPASLLPEEWMLDANALGTVDECVTSLQRWLDVGVDEVATYGSTPRQNAALIDAWRKRPQAPAAAGSPDPQP